MFLDLFHPRPVAAGPLPISAAASLVAGCCSSFVEGSHLVFSSMESIIFSTSLLPLLLLLLVLRKGISATLIVPLEVRFAAPSPPPFEGIMCWQSLPFSVARLPGRPPLSRPRFETSLRHAGTPE
eukprot:TRINITY_DN22228_c0_g2_i1.p2 TRINITY_DN22228_c0_g2~~TRINITY_DN22228_c0_g2_i1.p2  ORF type:complete len:125 (-),score=13.77 TRINITY_DN22228_c0_g2_i1:76-450(-)